MEKDHFYYIEKAKRLGNLAESLYSFWVPHASIAFGINLALSLMFSVAHEYSLETTFIVLMIVLGLWTAILTLLAVAIKIAKQLRIKAERYAQKCEC